MVKVIAGTEPPLIDLPLMVISCAPVRLITADEVYPDVDAVAVVAVAAVDDVAGELVVKTGVAVVEPPAAGLAVTVGAAVAVTGVLAVAVVAVGVDVAVVVAVGVLAVVAGVAAAVVVEAVAEVAGDEAVEVVAVVVAGLTGATIGSFLQDETKKAVAKKKAKESLVRPFRPSAF